MQNKPSIISLKNQKEFNEVNNSGTKLHGKYFIAILSKHRPTHSSGDFSLGLKVSRKMGNAVKRNKIKRWFREIIRQCLQENPKYLNYSIILIPKKSIISTKYRILLEDFKNNIFNACSN